MPACLQCGNRLCKNEVKCFTCDAPVNQPVSQRQVNMTRASTVLLVLFLVCGALTIISIFTDIGASFTKCAAGTVILHFVRMSAMGMAEKKGS
jgi:hypothetical protein